MKLTKEQVLKNLEDIVRFGGLTMSSEFVESVRIAMEAYEQEPCEDCISRQAVMELPRYTTVIGEIVYLDGIKALPSVQQKLKTEWIPVSKRLPKAGEYVGNIPKYYLVQNEFGDMLVARYTHSEYWEQIYQHNPIADEIVAWMPLPEPYKADKESDVE